GDFNGDGFLDLVTGSSGRFLSVLLNAGVRAPGRGDSATRRQHPLAAVHASHGDAAAPMSWLTSRIMGLDRGLTERATAAVRSPWWVSDLDRFFAALTGDNRQRNASRFAPAAIQSPRGLSQRGVHTDMALGLRIVPASPWLVLLEDNEHVA